MAKISKDDVVRLAKLSKIGLQQSEIERFQVEIEAILTHVEQLQQIDTDGVSPTYQVTGLTNVTRPDEIVDYGVSPKDLLKNTPDQQDNMIKVPKVL